LGVVDDNHLSFGDQLQQNDSVQPKLLMPLVILIGASGSGKTTIARAVQELHSESVDVLCEILDTSLLSVDESLSFVSERLDG
jgi:adenylylsulfate kinase-like enzyme